MGGSDLTVKGVDSATLVTKGMVGGPFGTSQPLVPGEAALPLPPPEPVFSAPPKVEARIEIVVPTAVNVCMMAAENIHGNLLVRQDSSLGLPSLYKRAYLVAKVTDEIAVIKQ